MSLEHLSDDDYDRLARVVSGEASAVERAEIERWADANPERRAALAAMRLAWRTPLAAPAAWDVDRAWTKLAGRITEPSTAEPRNLSKVVDIRVKRRWWHDTVRVMQVAAAVTVMVGGALVISRLRATGDSAAPIVASATEFVTGSGQRRTVRLPDGSTVVLGVSSTLRTRDGYGTGAREVDLTGEALFTVGHDASRPFRVHVSGTVVEDLGTEFAVRGYRDDGDVPSIRVAVASGSVAVRRGTTADTAIVLEPHDVATVRGPGDIDVSRGIDVSRFTAFASGRLIFADTPLAEVVDELGRWYGVEVRVTDASLLDRHLTSTFEGESLDEVLRIIGMTLDVRYVRNGNRVDFMGKGNTSALPPAPTAVELAETGA